MTLGEIIKQARITKGLSQKELAALLGTTPQNLAQYENNRRRPKINTLRNIASAMNVSLGELSPEIWKYYSPEEWGQNFSTDMKNSLDTALRKVPEQFEKGIKKSLKDLQQRIQEDGPKIIKHAHDIVDSDVKTIFLLNDFEKLNNNGRRIACERIKELTEIKKYTDPDTPEPEPNQDQAPNINKSEKL